MKRINDIYQQVYEWDNLLEAYRKARKGSSHSRDAILYSLDLHRNLANLQQLLVDGKAEVGNLTSQHFANFYLSFFDHHVKDVLRIKWYVRYMDDCILWASTKEELIACKKELTGYLESELRLTLKYSVINKTCSGVPFLGFLLKPDRILVLRSKKKRLHRTWKELYWQLRTDMIDQQLFADRISASLSHLRIARSRMFVYNFLQRYDFRLEPGPSGR
jgi:hypothetical protein